MSIAGMHDKTVDEDEDFDSIAPDRGKDERTLQVGDSIPRKCGKQKGRKMGNDPLTAKEQHKRKEKLAKIRQTVMIILMVIAGLYYLTVERSQVTDAAVVTSMKDAPETAEEAKEPKFEIESYILPETTSDETSHVNLPKIEAPQQNYSESISEEAAAVSQAAPNVSTNIPDTSAILPQATLAEDVTAVQVEDKRVNLNTATLEELDALPGVGPSTAKNIIAYRETHGGFAAPEEIMNVKRIGEKTFQKLKEFIKV